MIWAHDFICELAHKENQVLIASGALAPVPGKGFLLFLLIYRARKLSFVSTETLVVVAPLAGGEAGDGLEAVVQVVAVAESACGGYGLELVVLVLE